MRIGTFWYCLKEGIKNIGKNIWFSLASMAIISACIFLFCIFFSLVANVQYMVRNVETTVGITVFFDEDLGEAEIKAIGDHLSHRLPGRRKFRIYKSSPAYIPRNMHPSQTLSDRGIALIFRTWKDFAYCVRK